MNKHPLNQTLGLTLLVGAFLALLSLVPQGLELAGIPLRRMDIFSDIRPRHLKAMPHPLDPSASLGSVTHDTLPDTLQLRMGADTLVMDAPAVFVPLPPINPALHGQLIEDYSPEQWGLEVFFRAVDSIRWGKTARVAYYGDSFIEGDILLGDLRDSLQRLWGGRGPGLAPITSAVRHHRHTYDQDFNDAYWTTYSIQDKKTPNPPAFGVGGYVYKPRPGAYVSYTRRPVYRMSRPWNTCVLFYSADTETQVVWSFRKDEEQSVLLPATGGNVGVWRFEAHEMQKFTLKFLTANDILLYGISMESGPGLYMDNFSLRGNSGGALIRLRPEIIRQFDAVQGYDLVVVQVGLNAVTDRLDNIPWYRNELNKTFTNLRACYPRVPILIVSVADRGGKVDGELGTMISVPYIVDMQRDLARQHGFLFYDLFHGMGGEGTMVAFARQTPPLASAKDYTHLSHEGGKRLGALMASLFLAEWTKRQNTIY